MFVVNGYFGIMIRGAKFSSDNKEEEEDDEEEAEEDVMLSGLAPTTLDAFENSFIKNLRILVAVE